VNNPLGGMGLNEGIHDALVLGELLIDVLRRGAGDAVLNRYEEQRRPFAIYDITTTTEKNKKRMEERDPATAKPTMPSCVRTARTRRAPTSSPSRYR
jgi:2-polyprenyl-6-methoxyphenol hydroxylase-like FAD-dependent oxidoreductase